VIGLKGIDRRILPPDWVELAWTLYHEMGPTRSLQAPPELCPGLDGCWLVSATIPAKPLREGLALRVLALPGDDSPHALVVLPESLLDYPS
jgi:hypothetical protein